MSTAPYLRNLRKAELTELAEISDLKEYVFCIWTWIRRKYMYI
jgi:hypothetical protein